MIPELTEVNFPQYATLHEAKVTIADMGSRTIESQIRVDGAQSPIQMGVTEGGEYKPAKLIFNNELFVQPVRDPSATKENTSVNATLNLNFISWVENELKRYFFFQPASTSAVPDAGATVADQYQASINVSLEDFVDIFNDVVGYYLKSDAITMRLYDYSSHRSTRHLFEIDKQKIWDVLTKFYEVFTARWKITVISAPSQSYPNGKYYIDVDFPAESIDEHIFEYGYKGGLLKFERQIPESDLSNVLLGRGGEKNLPYRYFKLGVEEGGYTWTGDPDAIPELELINFDKLHDAAFRWYVRGWMQNSHRDTSWDSSHVYPSYTESNIPTYDANLRDICRYAFNRGKTDDIFSPVEYVADHYDYQSGSVVTTGSIAKYGEKWGYLEAKDEIYPSIRGALDENNHPLDVVIAVSKAQTDNIDEAAAKSAIALSIKPRFKYVQQTTLRDFVLTSEPFEVPDGYLCAIDCMWYTKTDAGTTLFSIDTTNSKIVAVPQDGHGTEEEQHSDDSGKISFPALQPGTYCLEAQIRLQATSINPETQISGNFGFSAITAVLTPRNTDDWKPTFEIWIPNIWGTHIDTEHQETPEEYAERVWLPILGDHFGNDAAVVFASGWLASASDYEFKIAKLPEYDDTEYLSGVGMSHWKLTLYKSEAEYNATKTFIPSEALYAAPGDEYFFIGIDMPFRYVQLKEEQLTIAKYVDLSSTKEIYPTWVVALDKVRINTQESADTAGLLINRLKPGARLKVTDPRFTDGVITLIAQSVSYTWKEPTKDNPYLVPDLEVVLTDKVMPSVSSYTLLQGQVNAIQSEYVRASDVEDIVRRIAGDIFLKKTGEADQSASPTAFSSRVSSAEFRQGGVGGQGWGIYRSNIKPLSEGSSNSGDSVIEADVLIARKELQVETLVVNQVEARGGKEILSAAKMQVSKVERRGDNYICFFDQKQGSVDNLFVKGDIAMCQKYDPAWNSITKYYRMVVVDKDVDWIELDYTTNDGHGVPGVGDTIVQFGNCGYTPEDGEPVPANPARQSVIIRDVIGGGYEQMLTGLTREEIEPEEGEEEEEPEYRYTDGVEYFFAGRQGSRNDGRATILVGSKASNQYIEYDGRGLTIKGYAAIDNVNGSTLIDGNLIQTGEIMLGRQYTPEPVEEGDTPLPAIEIFAGISGSYNSQARGNGIAAWYGGEKIDYEELTAADLVQSPRYARTLFRFDGSGYLAGSKIHWDNQGYGGIPGVTWSRDGQNDVIYISGDIQVRDSNNQFLSTLQQLAKISSWFQEDNDGNIKVLGRMVGGVAVPRAFYNEDGAIVAGAPGQSGGGGGGGGSTVSWDSTGAHSGYKYLTVNDVRTEEVALYTHNHNDLYYGKSTIDSALALKVDASSIGSAAYLTTQTSSSAISAQSDDEHLPTSKAVWNLMNAVGNLWGIAGTSPNQYLTPRSDMKGIAVDGFITCGTPSNAGGGGGGSSAVSWHNSQHSGYALLRVDNGGTSQVEKDVAIYGHNHAGESWLTTILAGYVPTSRTISVSGQGYTGYLTGGGALTTNIGIDISSAAKGYIDHGEAAYNLLNALFTAHYSNGTLESIEANADFWAEHSITSGVPSSGGSGGGGSAVAWKNYSAGNTSDILVIDGTDTYTVSLQGHGHGSSQITHGSYTLASLIPSEASSSNQFADKNFVNSSIATATATYRGSFNLVSDLSLSTTTATHSTIAAALTSAISGEDNNDYCFVEIPTSDSTPTEIARVDRYKYNGTAWSYEYSLNNSGFTAAQWAVINGGPYLPLAGGTMSNTTVVTNLNADLLDGQHGSYYAAVASAVKYGGDDNTLGQSSPVATAQSWVTAANLPNGNALVYNSSGAEFSLLFSMRPSDRAYGTILRWGYDTPYMWISRKGGSGWVSTTEWEKIGAGLADRLTNTRTIWGQNFNGTGDVTGHLYLGSGYIYHKCSDNTDKSVIDFSGDTLELNFGLAGAGNPTYIHGNAIHFKYGTDHSTGMVLHSNGKLGIGIGSTTPSEMLEVGGVAKAGSFNGAYLSNGGSEFYVGSIYAGQGSGAGLLLHTYNSSADNTPRPIYFHTNNQRRAEILGTGEFHSTVGIYSDGFITCGTPNANEGGGGTSVQWDGSPSNGYNVLIVEGDGGEGHHRNIALEGHTHDDRYYTETEIGNLLNGYLLTSNFTAANIVSTIGNTAVAKATDADTLDGYHASSFITSHQPISTLHLYVENDLVGSFNPTDSEDTTLAISTSALADALGNTYAPYDSDGYLSLRGGEMIGSINPETSSYSLGTTTDDKYWGNVVATYMNAISAFKLDSNEALGLSGSAVRLGYGSRTAKTLDLYGTTLSINLYNSTSQQSVAVLTASHEAVNIQKDLRPNSSGTSSLGASDATWDNLYLTAGSSIYTGSTARISFYSAGIGVASNLVPNANTINLGANNSTNYWNNLYAKKWYPDAVNYPNAYIEFANGVFSIHGTVVADGGVVAGQPTNN